MDRRKKFNKEEKYSKKYLSGEKGSTSLPSEEWDKGRFLGYC